MLPGYTRSTIFSQLPRSYSTIFVNVYKDYTQPTGQGFGARWLSRRDATRLNHHYRCPLLYRIRVIPKELKR